jgi:hypothetical protein
VRLSAVLGFDSQDVLARAALFRGFGPVDDQGESGEAKLFDILALMLGCKKMTVIGGVGVVDKSKVGRLGLMRWQCGSICTTNIPGGSSALGASSTILVFLESVPDRFRNSIVDRRCRQIFGVGCSPVRLACRCG